MPKAAISEIFPTTQGEGPRTGERQIFVRFAGCPLRCDYCDTPDSLVAKGHPRLSISEVLKKVEEISKNEEIKTVSLTGGEPLAQAGFLKDLLPKLQKKGFTTYLETAGIHVKGVSSVIKNCDIVSMDIKLPSATKKIFWKEHEEFLSVAAPKAFVKIVIEEHSTKEEFSQAIDVLKKSNPVPLLVLQPVTPINGLSAPLEEMIEALAVLARKNLPRVEIRKQQHKDWNIR